MVQNEPIAEASYNLLQFTISYLTSDIVSTKISNVAGSRLGTLRALMMTRV